MRHGPPCVTTLLMKVTPKWSAISWDTLNWVSELIERMINDRLCPLSITDHVATVGGAFYGLGNGRIFEVECTGTEQSVIECDVEAVSDTSNCTHSNDVGLACIGM